MGYSPWGRKESDTTEQLNHHHHALFLIFFKAQRFILLKIRFPWV